ncbi:RNA-directed DNA polymerase, eukaryota, reverse transcriptase zinc-binding domain protein, partial [Tanacetum coccineum]
MVTLRNEKKLIHDVHFAPCLAHNLMSVGQLIETCHSVLFDDGKCVVKNKRTSKAIAHAYMSHNRVFPLVFSSHMESAVVTKTMEETELWHLRYGHLSTDVLELIHADLYGPMKSESLAGSKYFLLFIDDHSRMSWVTFSRARYYEGVGGDTDMPIDMKIGKKMDGVNVGRWFDEEIMDQWRLFDVREWGVVIQAKLSETLVGSALVGKVVGDIVGVATGDTAGDEVAPQAVLELALSGVLCCLRLRVLVAALAVNHRRHLLPNHGACVIHRVRATTGMWFKYSDSAIHGEDGKNGSGFKVGYKSIWRSILQEVKTLKIKGIHLNNFMQKKLGNGADTYFWEDLWHGDMVLKQRYPRLYALEVKKTVDVASKLSQENLTWSFRRAPRSGVEQDQLTDLMTYVEGVVLGVTPDRWYWTLDGSGEFSVASARKVIDDNRFPEVSTQTRWIKAVPIKVNIHAWKVRMDCLPTRLNISRRGIDIPSILCPVCGSVTESSSHLFFDCLVAKDNFRKICRWWEVDFMEVHTFDEWVSWIVNLRIPIKHK